MSLELISTWLLIFIWFVATYAILRAMAIVLWGFFWDTISNMDNVPDPDDSGDYIRQRFIDDKDIEIFGRGGVRKPSAAIYDQHMDRIRELHAGIPTRITKPGGRNWRD